jgi:hypothetical protein
VGKYVMNKENFIYIYILAYIAPFIVLKLGPAGDPGLGAGARLG